MNNVWIFSYYVIASGPEGEKRVKSEKPEIRKSHLQKNVGARIVGPEAFFCLF